MKQSINKTILLVLHNIRSAHNVGSIFRTADAAGVSKIFLTGHTPAPVDRFGRKRKDFVKVSLGAEESVRWERVKNLSPLLRRLKKEKVFLCAVEQSHRSVDYKKIPHKRNVALIFGNEVWGLPRSILKTCGCVAEIPMHGNKESLNVSVAAGVVLFSLCDKIPAS